MKDRAKVTRPEEGIPSHPFPEIELDGMRIASVTREELIAHIFEALDQGKGLHLVTANLDILRRSRLDPRARAFYEGADLRVADGMPLVWASRLMGHALPERVAGSELVPAILTEAAQAAHSVYLIGGSEGVAERAADLIEMRFPGAKVAGYDDGYYDDPPDEEALDRLVKEVHESGARIVFIALGSPKQEVIAAALQQAIRGIFVVGVGASLSFLTGDLAQAPVALRRVGLEWLFRLVTEPRRLARRYLVHGVPFAFRLMWVALKRR
ncbi:MAG: WecB/TagA/CpsF family glycosyltransferase [Sandaracinaceae bacterium]|nr:WecB/TagA/CpsF family glycosyltransferase [Sandaracinaceae bacterium]